MKKLMALVLSFAMVFTAVPVFADAATGGAATDKTQMSEVTVEAIADQEYTGKAITIDPATLKVAMGTNNLVYGTDFQIKGTSYTNNVEPGQASFELEGMGDYTGTQVVNFNIVKTFTAADKDLVITVPDQTEGTTEMTGVTVKWGEKELPATAFTATGDNKTTGTKTATIKFLSPYAGTFTMQYNVVAGVKNLADAGIHFKELNKTYIFNGTEQKAEIYVKYEGFTLVEGTDYDVTYSPAVDAGTVTVTVKGKGAFEGEKSAAYEIKPADLKDATVVFAQDAYTATGKQLKPEFTVKFGDVVIPSSDYEIAAWGNNDAIGNGSVTIKAKDKVVTATASGNVKGEKTATFNIVGKAMADLDVALTIPAEGYTYDGKAKEPAVTVKDGDKVLVEGTDYTVEYADNVAAGKGKVIVTAKGTTYAGSKTAEFRIKGEDSQLITGYTIYTKYYGNKDFNLNAKISTGEAGVTFKYTALNPEVATVDVNGNVSIKHTGIAKFKVETVGTVASDPASKTVTVKVKPKKPAVSSLSSTKKGSVKVNVLKSAGSTKYEIRYGRMGNYKYKTIRHIDSVYTKTYTTVSKLTSGKTYYIKVRAITVAENGTELKGNWSSTKKIKVK